MSVCAQLRRFVLFLPVSPKKAASPEINPAGAAASEAV
jgi:hypothetical protein